MLVGSRHTADRPVGDDGRPGAAGAHAAGAARGRRRSTSRRASRPRPAAGERSRARRASGGQDEAHRAGLGLRARPAAAAAALRLLRRRRGAARRLRRQADRLQGRRPARSPPGRWCWSACRTRGSSSSASAPTARAASGSSAALAAGDLDAVARSLCAAARRRAAPRRRCATCSPSSTGSTATTRARALPRGRGGARRARSCCHRAPRARRARRPAAGLRGPGRAQHVPRGVRDGRRRGGGVRRAAGLAAHSGLAEVAGALAAEAPAEARPWLSFSRRPADRPARPRRAPRGVARAPRTLREETRAALVATARERWSWEGVARGVIAAAKGELDGLPQVRRPPPPDATGAHAVLPPVECRVTMAPTSRSTAAAGAALAAALALAARRVAGCGDGQGQHARPRPRQAALRGEVRLLPRARPRRARRASPDRTSTPRSASRWRRLQARHGRGRRGEADPLSEPATGVMPAKLVDGQEAKDVAAYVAFAVARTGQDTGPLATAVAGVAEEDGRRPRTASSRSRRTRTASSPISSRTPPPRPDR